MGSNWDPEATALLLACVDYCVASDNPHDLKTEVPRLMTAQGEERSWKSITAKLASLNRLFSGPVKRDVKSHGSGVLALSQEMISAISAARQSIEAAEIPDGGVDSPSAATAVSSTRRKRSRDDDEQENFEASPRKLQKTAAARPETLAEHDKDGAGEPEKAAGEPEKAAGEPSEDVDTGVETNRLNRAVEEVTTEASLSREQALEQRIKELEADSERKDGKIAEYEQQQAVNTAAGACTDGGEKAFLSRLQKEKQAMKEQRERDREFHQMVIDTLQSRFNQREAWYTKMINHLDNALGGNQMLAGGEASVDTQIGTPSCFTTPPRPVAHRSTPISSPTPAAASSEDRFSELPGVEIEYSPPGRTLSEAMGEDDPPNNTQLYAEPTSRRQSYDIDENYTDDYDDEADGSDEPTYHTTNEQLSPDSADHDGDEVMSDASDSTHTGSDDDSTSARNRRAARMSDFNINNILNDPQLAEDVLGVSQIADASEGAEFVTQSLTDHGLPTINSIAADAARSSSVDDVSDVSDVEDDIGNENESQDTAAQAPPPQTPAPRTSVPGDFGYSTSQLEPPSSAWSSAADSGLLIHHGPYTPAIRLIPPTPEDGHIAPGHQTEHADRAEEDNNEEISYEEVNNEEVNNEEDSNEDGDSTFQTTFDRNFPGYHFDDDEEL